MSRVASTPLVEWTLVAACALGVGCRSSTSGPAAPMDDERPPAVDAGFVYKPGPERARVPLASHAEAGVTPAILPFAGLPGGRGDLDGVGGEARIGMVGGMVRVGDAIVFADEGNGSIRRYTPATSEVVTLARVPRVRPDVPSLPWGIAYDGVSSVYVSDRSAHVIYRLDLATRDLSVSIGRPGVRGDAEGPVAQSLLDSPAGLTIGAGFLFLADTGNRKIRFANLTTGVLRTLVDGLMQPWGLCVYGNSLFVAESLQESILRVDIGSRALTSVAGSNRFGYAGATDGVGPLARFRTPRGVDCADGLLYVTDRGSGNVRRVDPTSGEVTTLAGSIANGLGYRDGQGIYALFRDVQAPLRVGGTLYVGDDSALRAVSVGDDMVRTAAGAGELLSLDVNAIEAGALLKPEGIVVSAADGAAFVAGGRSWAIHRVDLTNGRTTVFAGTPQSRGFADAWGLDARFGMLTAMTTDGRGTIFVADPDNHAVRALNIATRQVSTVAGLPTVCGAQDGPLDRATFCDPEGLAFDQGKLFVADASTHTVRRIDLESGTVSTLAGRPYERGLVDGAGDAARFSSPAGLAAVGGALYVADGRNDVVRRVDEGTGQVTTLPARFATPSALGPSGEGSLFVLDRRAVSRVSLATGGVVRLVPAGPGLHAGSVSPSLGHPTGIAELGPNEALVVDRNESAVVRLVY